MSAVSMGRGCCPGGWAVRAASTVSDQVSATGRPPGLPRSGERRGGDDRGDLPVQLPTGLGAARDPSGDPRDTALPRAWLCLGVTALRTGPRLCRGPVSGSGKIQSCLKSQLFPKFRLTFNCNDFLNKAAINGVPSTPLTPPV